MLGFSRRRRLVRNVDIGDLLDTLLVSAIGMILLIRLQLWATNYPKLGGGRLHIAHVLWGGLAMLVAIVVLLSFLGRSPRHLAAVIGGIGFGFFIDEVGKFVTTRNDYFFKPAAGIIYVVFIGLFLVTRRLQRSHALTADECLVNAAEFVAEAARGRLDERGRRLAMRLLARADAEDELVEPLRQALLQAKCRSPRRASWPRRLARRAEDAYFELVQSPSFAKVVAAVFVVLACISFVQAGRAVSRMVSQHQALQVISVVGTTASVAVAALILRGIYEMRESRLKAYLSLEHALFVQIFFAELFAFLESQFGAAIGLIVNIALIITVRYAIRAERHLSLREDEPAIVAASAAQPAPPAGFEPAT
jgi:hypothetical protein